MSKHSEQAIRAAMAEFPTDSMTAIGTILDLRERAEKLNTALNAALAGQEELFKRAEKAEQRCAALEALVRRLEWDQTDASGNDCCGECGNSNREGHADKCPIAAALSGDTSALREMLERAAAVGMRNPDDSAADIAKRVMEGK